MSTVLGWAVGMLLLSLGSGFAATPLQAPIERSGFARLTPHDSLEAFLVSLSKRSGITLRHVARSVQGRSVDGLLFADTSASAPGELRVLLFAQQHGDEPSGNEALTMLAARLAGASSAHLLDGLEILLVPQMNPDGAELRQRRTAEGVDQNRVHLLLSTPEVRGLHDLFLEWMPHVTVDVHEYSALSKSWLAEGIVRAADVQLGLLTNLNVPGSLRSYQADVVLPAIAERMKQSGYLFHEYIVGSPQTRIRHSTTEINDGRQSFGVFNTLSFIQEGRQDETLEQHLERRVRSQLTALEALLELCAERAAEIRSLVEGERARSKIGAAFVTVMEHEPGRDSLRIPVIGADGSEVQSWVVAPYHGEVRPLARERLPAAYLIPDSLHALVEVLEAHGAEASWCGGQATWKAGLYQLDSVWTAELEEEPHRCVSYQVIDTSLSTGHGYWRLGLDQPAALLIATFLEPGSMWGLSRYEQFADLYRHPIFPVLRIEKRP